MGAHLLALSEMVRARTISGQAFAGLCAPDLEAPCPSRATSPWPISISSRRVRRGRPSTRCARRIRCTGTPSRSPIRASGQSCATTTSLRCCATPRRSRRSGARSASRSSTATNCACASRCSRPTGSGIVHCASSCRASSPRAHSPDTRPSCAASPRRRLMLRLPRGSSTSSLMWPPTFRFESSRECSTYPTWTSRNSSGGATAWWATPTPSTPTCLPRTRRARSTACCRSARLRRSRSGPMATSSSGSAWAVTARTLCRRW